MVFIKLGLLARQEIYTIQTRKVYKRKLRRYFSSGKNILFIGSGSKLETAVKTHLFKSCKVTTTDFDEPGRQIL